VFLILPTADIVREYETAERTFSFYEDGLRGVIRDLILYSNTGKGSGNYIQDKILREYSNTPEAVTSRIMENFMTEIYVETLVEVIFNSVSIMMQTLLPHVAHSISVTEHQWNCNDLIIKIKNLDEKESYASARLSGFKHDSKIRHRRFRI
jgi:hypothetical protein